jgi:predicted acetyltransferase
MKLDQAITMDAKQRVEYLFESYMSSMSRLATKDKFDAWKSKRKGYAGKYWDDEHYVPFEISVSGQVIGFALINNQAKLLASGRSRSSFYIAEAYQSMGYGLEAARLLNEHEQSLLNIPSYHHSVSVMDEGHAANNTIKQSKYLPIGFSLSDDSSEFVLSQN